MQVVVPGWQHHSRCALELADVFATFRWWLSSNPLCCSNPLAAVASLYRSQTMAVKLKYRFSFMQNSEFVNALMDCPLSHVPVKDVMLEIDVVDSVTGAVLTGPLIHACQHSNFIPRNQLTATSWEAAPPATHLAIRSSSRSRNSRCRSSLST